MASPHVAAVAALIVSQGVKDPDDVKSILQKSAQNGRARKISMARASWTRPARRNWPANVYGDGVARFWLVVGLFAGCFCIGTAAQKVRQSAHATPFWGTAALAFGLLFPDWLTRLPRHVLAPAISSRTAS